MPTKLRVPLASLASLASAGAQRTAPEGGQREVLLDEASSRYVARVHRLGVGAELVVFDPEARLEADAVISEVVAGGRGVRCALGSTRPAAAVATSRVTLVQALGKGDKPEQVVRDATALGVARVVFAETARGVVVVGDRGVTKLRRWQAVAVEAARQSGRGDVPMLGTPMPLLDALAAVSDVDVRLCLDPRGSVSLGAALAERAPSASLVVLVGPEGGFDEAELESARERGFSVVSFGNLVLRTETAAVAVLGAILAFASGK